MALISACQAGRGDRMSAAGWVFLAAGILVIYYACFRWHGGEE